MNHCVLIIEELQKEKPGKSFSRRFFICKYQTLFHQLWLEYIPRTGNIVFTLLYICKSVFPRKARYTRPFKAFYNNLFKYKLYKYHNINYELKISEYGNNVENFNHVHYVYFAWQKFILKNLPIYLFYFSIICSGCVLLIISYSCHPVNSKFTTWQYSREINQSN